MKLLLFFVVSCLALHNAKGAPQTAVYKFVRCNPEGDQANCVTQQSPEMAWSPELPAKLPASAAQYLEAEPVQDDSPMWEDGPVFGSGDHEGSGYAAEDNTMADKAESETGSGESWTEKDGEGMFMRMFPSRSLFGEAKPAEHELREDHLLQP
ncbi:hypothetical protein D5F01_LYC03747 [Larimichthys crocea]|uniref:Uncharacterized protein n=2 Tax=Larimichthys crocea TaxID=215358 RepID=A0ACD3R0H8_LARCR|nr:serglycin [Larimichthys crocea]KAE8297132.1 hypothetical protein D5F01_LYC03747 [Larimichthys crocea]TMS13041.1 hypothetical protein E3U43_018116 [Larimichthys crocea]